LCRSLYLQGIQEGFASFRDSLHALEKTFPGRCIALGDLLVDTIVLSVSMLMHSTSELLF
jgi:hypothetical protein